MALIHEATLSSSTIDVLTEWPMAPPAGVELAAGKGRDQ
jgi:hypothetical protein